MQQGTIVKVAGPLIVASGMGDSRMYDVVRVSDKRLVGEIIELRGDRASIQVYEETGGLGPGAEVVTTGFPLSVELGKRLKIERVEVSGSGDQLFFDQLVDDGAAKTVDVHGLARDEVREIS